MSDIDATAGEIFTVSASAASGHSVAGSGPGTLSAITTTLNAGIVYGSGTTPPTDMITLSVTDAHGGSDKVNFIFQSASPPPTAPVTLASTSEKDVLFGTGNPDQFVFASNSNRDTIVDFTAGTDHIDLSALSSIVNSTTLNNFFATHVTSSGGDILIALDGNDTITLRNVPLSSLHATDFIVHA